MQFLIGGEQSNPFCLLLSSSPQRAALEQPETLLCPRLESNPIWEDLPCYLAGRQDSNGIISYDVLMPASDLDFSSLVFLYLRLPKFLRNLGLIERLIGPWSISSVWRFWFSLL